MAKKEKQPREYQGVRDEIREQHLKTKDMSFTGRLKYFWYYYKVHTLVTIIVLFFTVMLFHDILTAKDYNFYGVMLNANQLIADDLEASFAEYANLDTENFECFIDTYSTMSLRSASNYDMATAQKLIALTETRDIDAAVFDSEIFNNYSYNGMFADLRTLFTEDELARYQDSIYYIDYAEVLKSSEDIEYENPDLISYNNSNVVPLEELRREADKHRHPENMENPMPVGIFLDDAPFTAQTNAYPELIPVFGFASTSQRVETGKKYLEFLLDETIDFSKMSSSSAGY